MSEGNFVRVLKNQDVLALAFGAMVGWVILGTVFFLVARKTHDADAVRQKLEGMAAGNT